MALIRDIRLIPLAYEMPPIEACGVVHPLVASCGASPVEVRTEVA